MNHLQKKAYQSLFILVLIATPVFAHEGHDHAPGTDKETVSYGPITISAEAKQNLKLQVVKARVASIDKTLAVIGHIEAIPDRSASITSRISGRVASVQALEGALIKKGQPVIDVESRQIGDPPPHVTYKSPIDGIVIDRHVVRGDTVEPDKHLVEIADLTAVYAKGRIYEGQVSQIMTGQQVRISVESYPNEIFTGSIERIGGALDAETRSLAIWIRIENPNLKLRPNMRATLSIVTAHSEVTLTVPSSAVLGELGNYFVFVEKDSDALTFERRSVVLGIRDDQQIEITDGIFPGDNVVTVGNYQLQYVPAQKKPETNKNDEHKG